MLMKQTSSVIIKGGPGLFPSLTLPRLTNSFLFVSLPCKMHVFSPFWNNKLKPQLGQPGKLLQVFNVVKKFIRCRG